ncbi:hypothetical protein ACOSP7_006913 [Xanthoceras sorbifolium]
MDSVSIVNEAVSSNNVEMITSLGSTLHQNNATMQNVDVINPSKIDPDQFLSAAANGDIEPFKQNSEQLDLIVTPIKNTVLHINITSEKVSIEFVEEILGICPSLLLQVNAQGDTPLHVAAKFEHVAVVEVLIKLAKAQHVELESGIGAARQMLRMTNNKGNTALHEAVRNKVASVVRILVKEDPDFSYSANNCGETPLYIAAEIGFSSAVFELLETCSSATHEGPNGKTALHAAARRNYRGLTKDILEKKKSLTKEIDDNGWTPLHCAAYYGRFRVTDVLLEYDKSVAYIADKYRKMTPLHLAASRGHIDIIRGIISYCPDCYELVDNRGWNVLHFAMATLNKEELCSLAEIPLIKKLVHEKDVKGNTPLHVLAAVTPYSLSIQDIVNKFEGDKLSVNKQNVNVTNLFRRSCSELKEEIFELSKETGDIGSYPLGVIGREDGIANDNLKLLEKAKESHLVVAALIATVTFAAAFTLPGGYKSEQGKNQGTAILSRNSAFQSFVIADTIAMVFSMLAVFAYFIMSLEFLPLKRYLSLFQIAPWFVVVAMAAMVIAFVTGTYAVLSPSLGLAIATCIIGLTVFLLMSRVGYIYVKEL